MPVHLSEQELLGWLRGSLPPFTRKAIAAHLKNCPDCPQDLEELSERASYLLFEQLSDLESASAEGANGHEVDVPAIPGFRILGRLGRGGMGVVYRAWDETLGRDVAIKVILHDSLLDPACLKRFKVEARTLAQLRDERIIQIFDFVDSPSPPYSVMEYAAGGSLKELMAGKQMPAREAARRTQEIARGVAVAHAAGVIHRDLKPSNVLLAQSGGIKIGDFGLAKQLTGNPEGQTRSGQVSGTVPYMAPEQAEGRRELTTAADIYALGAILYEMLTGRVPFRGESDLETMEQVRTTDPVAPSRLQAGLPRDLETICLKCLEKEPGRRYATASELADDLQRFLNHEPIHARPVGQAERTWRWCRRNPLPASLAAVLLVALAGLLLALARMVHLSNAAEAGRQEAVEHSRRAEAKSREAEDRYTLLLRFVTEQMQTAYAPFPQTPGSQRAQQVQKLSQAESYLQELLKHRPADAWLRKSLAEVYFSLGNHRLEVGQTEEAEAVARKAVVLWQQLVQEDSRNPHYRTLLAHTYQLIGHLHQHRGHFPEALSSFQEQHALYAELATQQPSHQARTNAALSRHQVIQLLRRNGRAEEARRLAKEQFAELEQLTEAALLTPPNRHQLVEMYTVLADMYHECRSPAETQHCRQQAYGHAKELNREQPADPFAQYRLALCVFQLVPEKAGADSYTEARQLFEQAAESLTRQVKEDPANALLGDTLLACHRCLGECWERAGQLAQAVQVHQRGVQFWEELTRQHRPASGSQRQLLQARHQLLTSYYQLAGAQLDAKEPAAALATVRQAVAALEREAESQANDLEFCYQTAHHLCEFANPSRRAGLAEESLRAEALAESLRLAERSRDLFERLVRERPEESRYAIGLSHALVQIAKTRIRVGPHEEAEKALRQAVAIQRRLFEQAPSVYEYRQLLIDRHRRLGRFLQERGRLADAEACFQEAAKLCPADAAN